VSDAAAVVTGPYYEDLEEGSVLKSHMGRTITEIDNSLFTHLILNSNQIHFNEPYAEKTAYGRTVVNSTFTLALITGLATLDTSQNAFCNLGWHDVRLQAPVFVGDTLWAESEILKKRESRSRPELGIVEIRSRGINQDNRVVLEFRRNFMLYKRAAHAEIAAFPETRDEWTV
jgi:itaconyl-CoA hydratase